MTERTLIILKPDAVDRHLVGTILSRFESKGLQIAAMKLGMISPEQAAEHYAAHRERHFYKDLVAFMTGSPVVLLVLSGENAIAIARRLMGKTNCAEADPGTIRGDFGISGQFNLVHGSDAPEAAEREINIFFDPSEVLEFPHSDGRWSRTP